MAVDEGRTFQPIGIAVLTVSDTRTAEDDLSGDTLARLVEEAGHRLVARDLVVDEEEAIIARLAAWVEEPGIDCVISTGGTGITGRDVTPEAVEAVCQRLIPGFGELFRMLSFRTIGTSTIQSRAVAGVAGTTLIFALPGSPGAVRDAWDGILASQLDSRHRPCNFVELLPRLGERGRG